MASLATIAPRLARARDQYMELFEGERRRRRAVTTDIVRVEGLVAHRDLQLLRAGATGDRRYVKRRADKLDRAKARLDQLRHELAHLSDWRAA